MRLGGGWGVLRGLTLTGDLEGQYLEQACSARVSTPQPLMWHQIIVGQLDIALKF